MADDKQLEILKQGVDVWNKWRGENPDVEIDLSRADLFRTDLKGADFRRVDLRKADLSAADLSEVDLRGADLRKTDLSGADLSRVDFRKANLSQAEMGGANLTAADFRGAVLCGSIFIEANLAFAKAQKTDLRKANLSGADLSRANFFRANLSGDETWLERVICNGTNFSKANLSHANLSEAHLSQGTDFSKANLSYADLDNAYICGAILNRANLREARLNNARLGDDFGSVDLFKADLREVDAVGADFTGADLRSVKLQWSTLQNAILTNANLTEADLSEAFLNKAILVETNLTRAILTSSKVYGISAWNLKLEGAKQSNLVITREGEPTVMVDDLEVAQFIYMLLNREKLRDVLNTMTQKGVLILGRFADGGLDVLQAVAGEVRERGYLPMLFDFDKCDSLNFTQTVKVMVGLSRFVIADLSGPSVLKELEATVPFHNIPFIPIIEKGRKYPSMSVDLTMYSWFHWPPVPFANKEELVEELQETVIDPAEEIGKTREERRAILFPDTDR